MRRPKRDVRGWRHRDEGWFKLDALDLWPQKRNICLFTYLFICVYIYIHFLLFILHLYYIYIYTPSCCSPSALTISKFDEAHCCPTCSPGYGAVKLMQTCWHTLRESCRNILCKIMRWLGNPSLEGPMCVPSYRDPLRLETLTSATRPSSVGSSRPTRPGRRPGATAEVRPRHILPGTPGDSEIFRTVFCCSCSMYARHGDIEGGMVQPEA